MARSSARALTVGIDVGGTFTDAVLSDGATTWRAKAPTTPDDRGRGVLDACRAVSARAGLTLEELLPRVARFGLGTTAVTNVLAERSGRRVGLLCTAGFEDQIPLAKGRQVLDDGWVVHPTPVATAEQIVGIHERIDRDGRVLQAIEPDEVVAAARHLVDVAGVEALAVSFLWAFKNPTHEDAAVATLRRAMPELPVFSGAALNPIMREFERTTAALLNAYVGGAFDTIDALSDKLAASGLTVPPLLVHSGGGSITAPEARRAPLALAASGPAAGVAASMSLAAASDTSDVITCDMGGTSFDVAVISDGKASRRTRGDLMGIWTSLPQIEVESIGAGGGSIGWVDARGMLRVGPSSAGSVPGPACYGKGGTEPTVTDALVVLGYLDPARFLGGEMTLDVDAAVRACEQVGAPLGFSAGETAWGIREIALEGMVKAVRSLLNARGLDGAEHDLISYGGCGSLFTGEIAGRIRSPRVLVPELASVLSAFGTASADIRRERAHSIGLPMPVDAGALDALAGKLEVEVLDDLAADGVAEKHRKVVFEVDLRFRRQISELSIPLPRRPIDDRSLGRLSEAFRRDYARRYGEGALVLGASLELVTLRAIGLGRTVRSSLDGSGREAVADGTVARKVGTRPVQLGRDAERHAVAVFDGSSLHPGHRLKGPALVDGSDTTIWIPPKSTARVDERSTLLVEVGR
jgi:N-methylhydantoinase A